MKDCSSFMTDKSYSCTVEGCSMKFTNEDVSIVHKKRHDMILNLGLGQKGTTFSDQTPTPTQFIRNCEEVGLFQDLQNVNPFEETFKKAVEAVKSGQLTLEKSLQTSTPDDTLHTPNVFPHITDVPSVHQSDINKSESIPQCEELLKQDICGNDKNDLRDVSSGHGIPESAVNHIKTEDVLSSKDVNNTKSNLGENKVILNVPESNLLQLLTPEDSQSSSNLVVIKNAVGDEFSPLTLTVKEKLKKNITEKKTIKSLPHKVPIMKCPVKRPSNSNGSKFSKFSKNAKKLISELEISGGCQIGSANRVQHSKQKKISKVQPNESRSEFLARSRAASSRCREKKKMYLLYLEKINSELSTANQNLILINSLLRQEISDLRRELMKHKNCSAADEHTQVALTAGVEANLMTEKPLLEEKNFIEVQPVPPPSPTEGTIIPKTELVQPDEIDPLECPEYLCDASLLSFDVAEVILNSEPEESEIPLCEGNKPPDIIVRFNSVGNDFPAMIPSDSCIDRYIERAGKTVKQIYGEHSYYFKNSAVDIGKRLMNFKTFRGDVEAQITSEECKKLSALKIQIQQNDSLRDLSSLNSKVLLGPRTPPPLILLKPFKKRSLQSKKNEKT